MTAKRLLMASPNYWHSPFQVGSHHLARCFLRDGWEVAYLSDPISPFHVAGGFTSDLRRRIALYAGGGEEHWHGRLWTYVPGCLLSPHGKPVLNSKPVHRYWFRWSCPGVVRKVRERGFGDVDLLYIDSVHQSFWLDMVNYRQAVYRVADYNPQFPKYTQSTREIEEEVARRVDLVIYPSRPLEGYVKALGARQSLCLPNGVDFKHFATAGRPRPIEYRNRTGPIAVYVGVMPHWFHFEWVRQASSQLPHITFVLIGPEHLARHELGNLPNVMLLGCRPYESIPAYLQHAHVGLMPFNLNAYRRAVEVLNPQKLYAYLAAGLPVVASDWEALREQHAPAMRCTTANQFVKAIQTEASRKHDPSALRRFAAAHDWQGRAQVLNDHLQTLPGETLQAA